MVYRTEREKENRCVENLVETMQEDKELTEEAKEIQRLGRNVQGGHRPLKLMFKSQLATEATISKTWK